MIEYYTRHTTVTFILCVFFFTLGIYCLKLLPSELLPNFNPPVIAIITPLHNMEPKIAEKDITRPIEVELNNLSGIELLESKTNSKYSIIIVHFDWTVDINQKSRQVSDITQRYSSLLYRYTPGASPIFRFDLFPKGAKSKNMDLLITDLKQSISRINGVGRVSIEGQLKKELLITPKKEKLDKLGLNIPYLYSVIKDTYRISRLGNIKLQNGNYISALPPPKQDLKTLKEIKIPIFVPNEAPKYIKLTELADIEIRMNAYGSYSLANQKESISLAIIKETGANTLDIIAKTLNILEKFKSQNTDIEFLISVNDSTYIKNAQSVLSGNILVGTILTSLFILLFFKSLTPTFIVCISIPLSLSLTFSAMFLLNVSLNILSLAGISLGIGMVVDSSISAVSNILNELRQQKEQPEAAIRGVKDIALPIFSSTLTSLAVFLPIVFLQNIVGALFRDLALTIIFSLTFSMIISILVVPAMAAKFLTSLPRVNGNQSKHPMRNVIAKLDRWAEEQGTKLINLTSFIIHKPKLRVALLLGIMVSIVTLFNFLPPLEFLPPEKPTSYVANFSFSPNTSINTVNRAIKDFGTHLRKIIPVERTNTTITSTESKLAFIPQKAPIAGQDIRELKSYLASRYPHIKVSINPFSRFDDKVTVGTPLELKIIYSDLEDLQNKERRLYRSLKSIPTMSEIINHSTKTSENIDVLPQLTRLDLAGISTDILQTSLKSKSMNLPITSKIFMKSQEDIINPVDGGGVNLFSFTRKETSQNIFHHNLNNVAFISANFDRSIVALSTVMEILKRDIKEKWLIFAGGSETINNSFKQLSKILILSLVLIYAILAVQFGSIIHPITILFTFLLTFLGAIPGLMLCKEFTSAPASIGFIMLAGITVNNGILLVDHIITQRKKYTLPHIAIAGAIKARIAPILITSLTTITGMLPMVLGLGTGAEIFRGIAVVMVFGLFVSTFLSLVGIPMFYVTIEETLEIIMRVILRISVSGRQSKLKEV